MGAATYYHITVTATDSQKILWNGGERQFTAPVHSIGNPWLLNNSQLVLCEVGASGPVLLLNPLTGQEISLGEDQFLFHVNFIEKSARWVILSTSEFVSAWPLTPGRPILLGKQKPFRPCLCADTKWNNCILVCQQETEPLLKLIDLATQKTLQSWALSPTIFEKIGHSPHAPLQGSKLNSGSKKIAGAEYISTGTFLPAQLQGKLWQTLIRNPIANAHFLGVLRSAEWGPHDYWQAHEWVKIRIDEA